MGKIFVYCDESGAKGYADKPEATPGEVGVMAGILVPEEALASVQASFSAIARKYAPTTGKFHIADLPADQQEGLRKDLFDGIKAAGLPCFWYAVHVEGLHKQHKLEQEIFKSTRDAVAARHGGKPRIRRGSVREEPNSLHMALFSGFFGHVVAFLMERERTAVDLKILTDQVDDSTLTAFRELAGELLDMDPKVTTHTAYDSLTQKVVEGKMEVTVEWPKELDFNPVLQSVSINTVPATDGIVLAADVLANSLNHLFMSRTGDTLYTRLNDREAVAGHPLAQHLDAFSNWPEEGDLVGDLLHAHPKAKHALGFE